MRKFILILLAFVSVNTFAQTAIETPKFFDNTYLNLNVGASTPLEFRLPLENVNPTVGVKVGKWFNPIYGANIEGKAWFNSDFGTVPCYTQRNFVEATYVGANGVINWTNAFLGYKQDRKFTLSSETGIGWIHMFGVGEDLNDLGAKTGLDLAYHFNDKWALNVEPSVYWNLTRRSNVNPSASQTVQFSKTFAQFSLSVGVTYNLKTSNGTHTFKTYNIGSMNNEINSLRKQLAKKPTEIIREIRTEKTVYEQSKYIVFFAQNSSELTAEAITELSKIKKGSKVSITGSASIEGPAEYNYTLSEKRANVVAEFLAKNGVVIEDCKGIGAVNTESGRVAIIVLK